MAIEVQEVTRLFGTQKALDNVSFSIGTGEVIGFLGPNGAGKSTLMRIITGYIPPSSGRVIINGQDVSENNIAIRQKIGYLPENNPLYPEMYVREYLRFTSRIYRLGRGSEGRINEIIGLTGLGREQHKKIGALSKGYRQRVGLAQALIHDPEILILDEPTSGLDPNQIVEIRELIVNAGKSKTVMLSTHIMQEVEAVCGRIIIIDRGVIRADDSPNGIFEKLDKRKSLIEIEFDRPVDEENMKGIGPVKTIRAVGNNKYLIESSGSEDIRPLVFRFAVDNNYTVLSMREQEESLESAFRQLTDK